MIFVDTGAWIARFSRRDQYHPQAAQTWERLKTTNQRIVTSDSVFAETISLLCRKVSPAAAVDAGRFLHGWNNLVILRAAKDDESNALDLLQKFADQDIGFVDCLSFALMRRHRISMVFTFDQHFEYAGFQLAS